MSRESRCSQYLGWTLSATLGLEAFSKLGPEGLDHLGVLVVVLFQLQRQIMLNPDRPHLPAIDLCNHARCASAAIRSQKLPIQPAHEG
jgi:hypothetical protein